MLLLLQANFFAMGCDIFSIGYAIIAVGSSIVAIEGVARFLMQL